jgi:hypothetical protein
MLNLWILCKGDTNDVKETAMTNICNNLNLHGRYTIVQPKKTGNIHDWIKESKTSKDGGACGCTNPQSQGEYSVVHPRDTGNMHDWIEDSGTSGCTDTSPGEEADTTNTEEVNSTVVELATDKIEELIDSDGLAYADTNEVTEAAEILTSLDPQDADGVIAEMAKRGILDDFAAEVVDDSWIGGGLSADNRATLFDNLAKRLNADSLNNLIDAFTPQGEGYTNELVDAINNHASAPARGELIENLASRGEGNDLQHAATLLAGLSGDSASFENTLTNLKDKGNLDDVIQNSVKVTDNPILGGGCIFTEGIYSHDTSNFDAIMQGTAQLCDAGLKADVFMEGVRAMQQVDDKWFVTASDNNTAATEMANSLTQILDSDTEGVMEALYHNDTNGEMLIAYVKQMMESGQVEVLGKIFSKLLLGNNLNESPLARMETSVTTPSGGERYQNSESVGHFIGSVNEAGEQITSDQEEISKIATSITKTF